MVEWIEVVWGDRGERDSNKVGEIVEETVRCKIMIGVVILPLREVMDEERSDG